MADSPDRPDILDADVGTWQEYRRYVVNQLRDTVIAMGNLKDAISEQRIKMAALDAHLTNVLDGSITKRIEKIEETISWAKGIGAVAGLAWSAFLVWLSHYFK
jgi:hypothetical protein